MQGHTEYLDNYNLEATVAYLTDNYCYNNQTLPPEVSSRAYWIPDSYVAWVLTICCCMLVLFYSWHGHSVYSPLATCQYDEQAVLQSFRESVTIIVLLLIWLKPWNIASPKSVVNILMGDITRAGS